ncbi:hypothetical protein JVT61DRAFT_14058 [Boletus reticuloceps]|uniref:Uncharacterized protein n=1 Tax=Boletus reticuloceps TaxID=495285 RepID=A0A8I2YSK4_9AGAM|nr:hypothetical protein JVT61DRAFT_14058 [Boletus reticuloceps]
MLHLTTGSFHKLRSAPTIESAMQHERKMNMLGVNYRSSPIVLDAFTQAEPGNAYGVLEEGVLVAGDRPPDATELRLAVAQAAGGVETGETKLFDVFGPIYHAALVLASSTDVLDVLKRYPKDVIRSVIILPQGAEMIAGTQADMLTGGTWRRRERRRWS